MFLSSELFVLLHLIPGTLCSLQARKKIEEEAAEAAAAAEKIRLKGKTAQTRRFAKTGFGQKPGGKLKHERMFFHFLFSRRGREGAESS
jgi:hypothetical protein